MERNINKFCLIIFLSFLFLSCNQKTSKVPAADILALNLKKGEIVLCGPPDKNFGSISFPVSCPPEIQSDFNQAVALLHSFEYDEAEKVFAKIISKDPGCAMAYWGVAMSNFHPLWAPSGPDELVKGARAIQIARLLPEKSAKETGYIDAIVGYYAHRDSLNDHLRCIQFEKGMEILHAKYPEDKEAAIFYALALDAAADPADKSYSNQRKAGAILNSIYPGEPNHPGVVHYIIHTYDYPGLAIQALPAARKYASIAPASAHAQHMPSHIFIRLGLWEESIRSNLISTAAAKCYADNAHMKGHWDEEFHGLDYLEYAYLQRGDNSSAKEQLNYLQTIQIAEPANFKVAYAFAAIPARYLLENKNWKGASLLQLHPTGFPWNKFPWQKAIYHFARTLGNAHTRQLNTADKELNQLKIIYDTLIQQKDNYKANQVNVQINAAEAWILLARGERDSAVYYMTKAADLEDATEKSPVTPGEVIPARELLADMLMDEHDFAGALAAYDADLGRHPNRFNGLYGAGLAAERTGNSSKAAAYYRQLVSISIPNSPRPEWAHAKNYLDSHP